MHDVLQTSNMYPALYVLKRACFQQSGQNGADTKITKRIYIEISIFLM